MDQSKLLLRLTNIVSFAKLLGLRIVFVPADEAFLLGLDDRLRGLCDFLERELARLEGLKAKPDL